MKARDIMMRYPKALRPDDPLDLAAQIMAWAHIRHLPVTRDGKLIGLLTERDLVVHQTKRGEGWHNDQVAGVMREHPQTANPEDSVTEIAARMAEYKIGCLPVVERGQLRGMITTTDILKNQVQSAMAGAEVPASVKTVAEVMSRQVEIVHPDDRLLDAASRMQQRHIRHLPVVDGDEQVIGMLSDTDVRAAIGDPRRAILQRTSPAIELLRVSDAMSTPPITTSPERPCSEVAREFVTLAASAVPVTDDAGKLLGMLSYVDVLRGLAER